MEIVPPAFDVWIEPEECLAVREALRRSGEDRDRADSFSGAELHGLLEAWQTFVDTDWRDWDVAEYRHDIAVRHRLEIILRALGRASQDRLAKALQPLDAEFKRRMRPEPDAGGATSSEPFWVANTIWNTPG